MDGQTTLAVVRIVVALIGASVVAAFVARRFGIPDAIAFVVVGFLANFAFPALPLAITPELVLAVLLPGLVFEAAYRLHYEDLRRSYLSITFLAIPGVILSATIVAAVLVMTTGLRPELAFVVGAMVSATDPAAVVSTFSRLGAPRRLVAIVDAESLLNDGTGLAIFAIAVAAVAGGIGFLEGGTTFVLTIVVSTLIGVVVGAAAALAVVRLRDHQLQVSVSLLAAYGAYLLADGLHFSGVIASVLAGILLGNFGRRIGLRTSTERAMDEVWEFLAFVLTALIFLLVGIAIGPAGVLAAFGPVVWGTVAVLVARAVVIYGFFGGALRLLRGRRAAPNIPVAWLHLMFWAGLRGAVATAAALALPASFPERELLQRIAFGIVVSTLLIQGTTAGWVVRRTIGVSPATDDRHAKAAAT